MTHPRLIDIPCDLCGERNEEFLCYKESPATGYNYRLVACRSCGHIFFNPRPHPEFCSKIFRPFDYASYDGNIASGHDMYVHVKKALLSTFPPPAKLLDFGCGACILTRDLKDLGYSAEGYDISEAAAERGRKEGVVVYTDEDHLPKSYYDLALAIEVLEHVWSPSDALRIIHSCLVDGGRFYYTTGDFEGFYGNIVYAQPEQHLNFFTAKTMRKYMESAGFRGFQGGGHASFPVGVK